MSELRKRFIETLGLKDENVIFPENSQFYVAIGAALMSDKHPVREHPLTFRENKAAGHGGRIRNKAPAGAF